MNFDPFVATIVDNLFNRQSSRIPNRVLIKPALKIKKEICLIAIVKPYSIHAEIQLLLRYERHFNNHSFKIISSYKKACYFCNFFFELHEKFILFSTHEKLYEK